MRKILVASALFASLFASQAHAWGDTERGIVQGIGATLLFQHLTRDHEQRRYEVAPPVVYAPAPRVIYRDPYGIQPNPYLTAYPPSCYPQTLYDASGYPVATRQVCN
jgi:hypothetical protein